MDGTAGMESTSRLSGHDDGGVEDAAARDVRAVPRAPDFAGDGGNRVERVDGVGKPQNRPLIKVRRFERRFHHDGTADTLQNRRRGTAIPTPLFESGSGP